MVPHQRRHPKASAATETAPLASRYLAEAFVYGKSVRAVCGTWFVPTRDESASLPICDECDEERPIAQAVVDLIRSQLSED